MTEYICQLHSDSKKKPRNILFDIAFVLYISGGCFRDACDVLVELFPVVTNWAYMFWLSPCLSLVVIILSRRLSLLQILLFVLLSSLAIYIRIANEEIRVLLVVLLLFAAKDIQTTHIIKVFYYTTLVTTLFVFLLSIVGLLPDLTYSHDVEQGVGSDGHSYGFVYYSGFGFRIMALVASYLYIHRYSCRWSSILIISLFSLLAYYTATTRLQLLVSFSFIFFFILIYKYQCLSFDSIIWKFVSIFAYPVALLIFAFIGLISLRFPDSFDFWDYILNGRLATSLLAFAQYPITLFGNYIEMRGWADTVSAEDYFYIDSGYVYWILSHGLLFTLFIIVAYSYIFYKSYKYKDYFIFVWMLIFTYANMVNDFFTSSYLCPTILFMFAKFEDKRCVTTEIIK